MPCEEMIYIVDRDAKRRTGMARVVYECGRHAEPCSDIDEFSRFAHQDGFVFCFDEPGADMVRQLHRATYLIKPSIRLLAYSENPKPQQIVSAMLGGALSYLELPLDPKAVLAAIEMTPEKMELAGARSKRAQATQAVARLSTREREVLRKITVGCGNKEIAHALSLSPRTVEAHRANLLVKLQARSTSDAVRIGVYAGLDEAA